MEVKNIKVELLPIENIKPYHNNPRNNDNGVEYLVGLVHKFGWRWQIMVDENYVIIAGHTRYEAAKRLGMKKIPCNVVCDLSPAEIQAFRIADNEAHDKTGWDFDLLDVELQDLAAKEIDMSIFDDLIEQIPEYMPIDDDGNGTTQGFEHILKIDRKSIVLTDEEHSRFMERYNNYVEREGVVFGFVKELLDAADSKH